MKADSITIGLLTESDFFLIGFNSILTISSVGLTTIYPVWASYRAYTQYHTITTKSGASTFHVGGVAIPVGAMLKRATQAQNQQVPIEEDTLNYYLLNVQMWFVYWVVTACITVIEDVFFVKSLPLYSLGRLVFSAWLMFPITNFASLRSLSKVLTFEKMQTEWQLFSNQGCGLIYFKYMVPLLEKKTAALSQLWRSFQSQLSPESIRNLVPEEVSSIGLALGSAASAASASLPEDSLKNTADGYLHNLSGFVGTMFSSLPESQQQTAKDSVPKSSSSALMSDKVFAEYTVVDNFEVKENQQERLRAGSSSNLKLTTDTAPVASGSRFRIW